MKKVLGVLVGFLMIFGMAMNAGAYLIAEGDPIEGNSWYQAFEESGAGNFDTVEAFMITGDPFLDPPFTGYSQAGWDTDLVNPNYALGWGPTTTNLNWTFGFSGAKSDPLSFAFFAWEGDIFREAALAAWTGSGWNISALSQASRANYPERPVPEPTTILLLGTGFAGLVGFGRKKLLKK